MIFLDSASVEKQITAIDFKEAISSAIAGLSEGTSKQPPKIITELSKSEGDCMFFCGMVEPLNAFGVKVSPFLPALSDSGKPPVTAWTMLVSSIDGNPILMCDSKYLTAVRTAETTAIGVDFLAPENSKTLCLVGSGLAASEHLRVQLRDRAWDQVSIYSPNIHSNPHRIAELMKLAGGKLRVAESAEDASSNADVILLCTSSGLPVLDLAATKENCLICSISTDANRAHEIQPNEVPNLQVYVDYRETITARAGELEIAEKDHSWSYDRILADLPELLTGVKKVDKKQTHRRFFRTTGLAVADIAAASALAQKN